MGDTHSSSVTYKLVFLDIDGVLNNYWSAGQLSCPLVSALAAMLRATGAAVVLSSMWRLKPKHRRQVTAAFLVHGVPLFISCTPRLQCAQGWRYARVQEILAWLQWNTTIPFRQQDMVTGLDQVEDTPSRFDRSHYTLPVRINVSHFVALDDIDMRQEGSAQARRLVARHHFVRTLMQTGLTEHNLRQAQHILADDYPRADMVPMSDTKAGGSDANVLLPYRDMCEQCEKNKAQHYDTSINKYFCEPACRDKFYAQHLATQ
jgi:hypothetical protein